MDNQKNSGKKSLPYNIVGLLFGMGVGGSVAGLLGCSVAIGGCIGMSVGSFMGMAFDVRNRKAVRFIFFVLAIVAITVFIMFMSQTRPI